MPLTVLFSPFSTTGDILRINGAVGAGSATTDVYLGIMDASSGALGTYTRITGPTLSGGLRSPTDLAQVDILRLQLLDWNNDGILSFRFQFFSSSLSFLHALSLPRSLSSPLPLFTAPSHVPLCPAPSLPRSLSLPLPLFHASYLPSSSLPRSIPDSPFPPLFSLFQFVSSLC